MYARVTRWEGGDADAIRESAQEMASQSESGPPEGVPAVGFTYLIDPDGGRALAIALFKTEEDRRKGDETLNSMSPPNDEMGKRGPVEFYEVAVDVKT